jgi:hypothetical protein
MSNISITDVDQGAVFLEHGPAKDELLTFAGAATMVEGTILARNTASGKLVAWEPGGTGGNEAPIAVLSYDVTAAGAGDEAVRVALSGVVAFERLVDNATGNNSTITDAHRDALGSNGFQVVDVKQLARTDNQ